MDLFRRVAKGLRILRLFGLNKLKIPPSAGFFSGGIRKSLIKISSQFLFVVIVILAQAGIGGCKV